MIALWIKVAKLILSFWGALAVVLIGLGIINTIEVLPKKPENITLMEWVWSVGVLALGAYLGLSIGFYAIHYHISNQVEKLHKDINNIHSASVHNIGLIIEGIDRIYGKEEKNIERVKKDLKVELEGELKTELEGNNYKIIEELKKKEKEVKKLEKEVKNLEKEGQGLGAGLNNLSDWLDKDLPNNKPSTFEGERQILNYWFPLLLLSIGQVFNKFYKFVFKKK